MIVGVLLAAGGARRFGSQKLVAVLDGVPLVRRAADVLSAVTDALIVVVGNEAEAVRAALDGTTASIVENASWADGMSTSLVCGIGEALRLGAYRAYVSGSAVASSAECVLIALGDQPGIDPEVARAVITRWRETKRPIVLAQYADGHGHPVLFARELFGELLALSGDVGAKSVIARVPERISIVEVPTATPPDIDTVEDLRGKNA
jgi:molybdenum cofactor cytidylyltransferase